MKRLITIAIVAATAVSCVKTEISGAHDAAIVFEPLSESITKASVQFPTNRDFCVYAWYHEKRTGTTGISSKAPLYIDRVRCTFNAGDKHDGYGTEGAWLPNESYYWPNKGYLTFSAYSPADFLPTPTVSALDGIKIENYSHNTLQGATDLLISKRAENKTTADNRGNERYDGVDLVFCHAFAAAEMAVWSNVEDGAVRLTGISLLKLKYKADFGEFTDGLWTAAEETKDYAVFSGTKDLPHANSKDGAQALCNLLLLPQDLAQGQEIRIDYSLRYFDPESGNNNYLPLFRTYKLNEILIPDNKWKPGLRYRFYLKFDPEDVHISPEVTDWKTIETEPLVQ